MSIVTKHIIKNFEGCELTAYRDVAGVLTIGYGHTGPDVFEGMTISKAAAEDLLALDMAWAIEAVDSSVTVPITETQRAALVSLTYNIGAGAWRKSTALKRLNNRNYAGAGEAILWWNKAGGKVVQGLVNRREAERALFMRDVVQESGELKPMKASKEQAAGLLGVIAAAGKVWADTKASVPELVEWAGAYAMYGLIVLFGFFIVNRWMARRRGDR